MSDNNRNQDQNRSADMGNQGMGSQSQQTSGQGGSSSDRNQGGSMGNQGGSQSGNQGGSQSGNMGGSQGGSDRGSSGLGNQSQGTSGTQGGSQSGDMGRSSGQGLDSGDSGRGGSTVLVTQELVAASVARAACSPLDCFAINLSSLVSLQGLIISYQTK